MLDYCTLRFVLHLTHDVVFHGRDKQMNGSIHSSSLGLPKSRRLTELEPLQTGDWRFLLLFNVVGYRLCNASNCRDGS